MKKSMNSNQSQHIKSSIGESLNRELPEKKQKRVIFQGWKRYEEAEEEE